MGNFQLDFVGVGSGKAGTTWVAHCLREHPQICIGKGKEMNYFCKKHPQDVFPARGTFYTGSHRDKGIEWLKSRFEHREPGQLLGEISPSYMFDPETPDFIYEHNPRMKLIFNFRNPAEVVYSAYHQYMQFQPLYCTFEGMLEKYSSLLVYPRFYSNVQRFLKRFPLEQMHFIVFDDIKIDSLGVYLGLCRFLGIDETFVPQKVQQRVNPRKTVRSRLMRDIFSRTTSLLNRNKSLLPVKSFLNLLGLGKMAYRIHYLWNKQPASYIPMKPETRARLIEMYKEENLKLGEFLGRDLSHWNE